MRNSEDKRQIYIICFTRNDNERASGNGQAAFREVTEVSQWMEIDWHTHLDFQRTYPAPCAMYALSCGAASDVFGIHGDKVVYDDGAHGEATESVGERE